MTTPSLGQTYGLSLAVFEPLVQGNRLIDDSIGWRIDALTMIKGAFGDLLELQFDFRTNERQIENWLDNGLGRHVELYSPGLSLIWDGYVSTVNANLGTLTLTRGPLLDVVANRVSVIFSTIDTSTSPPTLGVRAFSDWYEDTDSQAQYGIIEQVKSTGGVTPTEADQIAQAVLADKKQPETREAESLDASSEPSLSVTCRGYIDWFDAYTYEERTTGTQTADAKIIAILDDEPNGIISTDQSLIESNANTTVGKWEDDADTALSLIKGIVSLGDDDYDRWTFGLLPGRIPYYKAIPIAPLYQRTRSAPQQRVEFYGTGRLVYPWNVQPGQWVFYTDLLTSKALSNIALRDDPRYLFIEQVTYSVPWGLKLDGAQVSTTEQLLDRLGLGGSA